MHRPHLVSGGRYPVLRAISIILLIIAAVWILAGIVSAFYVLVRGWGNATDRVFLAIASLAGSFVMCIFTLAMAELIKLYMDIEHNTRMWGMNSTAAAAAMADPAARGRMSDIDTETAEGALLRGH